MAGSMKLLTTGKIFDILKLPAKKGLSRKPVSSKLKWESGVLQPRGAGGRIPTCLSSGKQGYGNPPGRCFLTSLLLKKPSEFFKIVLLMKKQKLFLKVTLFLFFSLLVIPQNILAAQPEKFYPRVYILIFNPILESKNNLSLIQYKNWNSPFELTNNYIERVKKSSHFTINYKIVDSREIDDIPLKADGFDYTDETYLACIEGTGPCHNNPWYVDYANYQIILENYQICQMINEGKIEELWMFGGPWFGFYEANMAGPHSFYTNGPIIEGTSCQKPLHIMGFNYERGVAEMLENLGHRLEGTFNYQIGNSPNNTGYGWGQFKTNKKDNPSLSFFGCGTVHCPPNAAKDYDYYNSIIVSSNCDAWLNYPDPPQSRNDISCNNWDCSRVSYLEWWLFHIPHAIGIDSRLKKNNWWTYVTNSISKDLNNNGSIEGVDTSLLLLNYSENNSQKDFNYDGKINSLDLGVIYLNLI